MDLSAVIFVVLALAWAVYLIPKALKHHDEMASDRLVEAHSDRVRVLRRKTTTSTTSTDEDVAEVAEVAVEEVTVVRRSRRQRRRDARRAVAANRPAPRPTTLRAARQAARRRRRVLLVLVMVLAAVAGLAYAAIVPVWSPAVPGALILAFLVVARMSVRRSHRAASTRRTRSPVTATLVTTDVIADEPTASTDVIDVAVSAERQLDREADALLADDGALWDPLPLTLPTYVNKARARRTVRTIELTGMQSSGHSEADTALAREAEEKAAASAAAAAAQRRAAGA